MRRQMNRFVCGVYRLNRPLIRSGMCCIFILINPNCTATVHKPCLLVLSSISHAQAGSHNFNVDEWQRFWLIVALSLFAKQSTVLGKAMVSCNSIHKSIHVNSPSDRSFFICIPLHCLSSQRQATPLVPGWGMWQEDVYLMRAVWRG